jgi:hypothetical protein
VPRPAHAACPPGHAAVHSTDPEPPEPRKYCSDLKIGRRADGRHFGTRNYRFWQVVARDDRTSSLDPDPVRPALTVHGREQASVTCGRSIAQTSDGIFRSSPNPYRSAYLRTFKPRHVVVLIRKSLALDCIRFRNKFVSLFEHVSFRQLAHVEQTRFQRSVTFK